MFIDDALNLTYAYVKGKCDEYDLNIITKELLSISGKKKYLFEEVKASSYEYQTTQSMLAKLNERESIRKSKGVYYTHSDVVHFIVTNSIKSAFGKLTPENIGDEDLSDIPFRSFATKKTVFDPTCGFRVIIMTQANSHVNTRVLELLPKFKIKKMNSWCAV